MRESRATRGARIAIRTTQGRAEADKESVKVPNWSPSGRRWLRLKKWRSLSRFSQAKRSKLRVKTLQLLLRIKNWARERLKMLAREEREKRRLNLNRKWRISRSEVALLICPHKKESPSRRRRYALSIRRCLTMSNFYQCHQDCLVLSHKKFVMSSSRPLMIRQLNQSRNLSHKINNHHQIRLSLHKNRRINCRKLARVKMMLQASIAVAAAKKAANKASMRSSSSRFLSQ